MNKRRVQSIAFQAAEIELEERCSENGVTYETFDLYEDSEETNRRRVRLQTKIRRFVFFSYVKLEEVCLFLQYHVSLSLPLAHALQHPLKGVHIIAPLSIDLPRSHTLEDPLKAETTRGSKTTRGSHASLKKPRESFMILL